MFVSLVLLIFMCYSPVKTKLNKRYLNAATIQRPVNAYFDVPCGQCEQCREQRVHSWTFRLLQHANEVLRLGGFIIFDTFTYRSDSVPSVSSVLKRLGYSCPSNVGEILCNNKYDVQCFLKRLRSKLPKSVIISYFLVSEYGDNDQFTHRPHYHALIFVVGFSGTPADFSRLLASCWGLGRTDGVSSRGLKSFLSQRCFTSKTTHLNNIILYIAKYLHKDYNYHNKVIRPLVQWLAPVLAKSSFDKYSASLIRRKLVGNIENFLLVSKGLGSCYCTECNSLLHVYELNVVYSDSYGHRYKVALPRYYVRKWYYTPYRDSFILNSLGLLREREVQRSTLVSLRDEFRTLLGLPFADASRLAEIYYFQFNNLHNPNGFNNEVYNNALLRCYSSCFVSGTSPNDVIGLDDFITTFSDNKNISSCDMDLIKQFLNLKYNLNYEKQNTKLHARLCKR